MSQGLGLCFPFLIVEAKSGATGGNLFQAQNQAAVSGASAINILKSLEKLYVECCGSGSPSPEAAQQHHARRQQHQDQLEDKGTREDLPLLCCDRRTGARALGALLKYDGELIRDDVHRSLADDRCKERA